MIFGIGLSRTGTTSLAHALKQVGINVIHYPSETQMFSSKTDGACDIPVAAHYKELDEKFPGSKFVYTIRNKEEWLESVEKYLKRKKHRKLGTWQEQNRIKVYGQVNFDKEIFAEQYDAHDRDIQEYFKGREQDLLILNICGGDDLKMLLDFIGTSSDNKEFPHENKRRT